MNVWFTADTHFGDAKVAGYRGFADARSMDEALVAAWNRRVGRRDQVYHLGDLCSGTPEQAHAALDRLRGLIYVVRGNHDAALNDRSVLARLAGVWDRLEFEYRGYWWFLSHYPHISWNRSKHGSLHLHGHSHGLLPDRPRSRSMDVGVDGSGLAPWPADLVLERLLAKVPDRPRDLLEVSHAG